MQTGVKSLGWLNSTPHDSPSQSWKLISPWVVEAVKSGAVSPRRMAMVVSCGVGFGGGVRQGRDRYGSSKSRQTWSGIARRGSRWRGITHRDKMLVGSSVGRLFTGATT